MNPAQPTAPAPEGEAALAMLRELLDAYIDACWQGSGNEPCSTPTWHNFLSAYEDADELIPRVRAFLDTRPARTEYCGSVYDTSDADHRFDPCPGGTWQPAPNPGPGQDGP